MLIILFKNCDWDIYKKKIQQRLEYFDKMLIIQ